MATPLRKMIQIGIDAREAKQGAREVDQAMDKVVDSTREGRRELERYDKEQSAVRAGAGRLATGLLALAGGFSALAVVRSTLSTYADFEEVIATVGEVSGASAAELLNLEGTARQLGATTRFSATEAGEGLLFLARAGFSVSESIEALPATLNLATVGVLDLGTAADFASNIVSQFGLAASDTERVVDVLSKTANSSNTDVRQLAEAMKFAGPVAGALGQEVEDTAAAIGVLGDSGIQASLAGTNLRGILSSLLDPTTEGRKAIEEMGLSLEDLDPATNTVADVFSKFAGAGFEAADAVQIFGRRNAAAALVLAANVQRIEELAAANLEAGGTAQSFADTLNKTQKGSLKAFISAVQEAQIAIGEELDPAVKATLGTLTETTRILGGVEGASADAGTAANLLAGSIRFVGTAVGIFIAIKLPAYLASVVIGLGGVRTAAIAAALAFDSLNAALGPAGWIAIGLSAAATAATLFRDRIEDVGDEAESAVPDLDAFAGSVAGIERAFARATRAEQIGNLEEQIRALRSVADELEDVDIGLVGRLDGDDGFVDLDLLQQLIPEPSEETKRIFEDASARVVEQARQAFFDTIQNAPVPSGPDPLAGMYEQLGLEDPNAIEFPPIMDAVDNAFNVRQLPIEDAIAALRAQIDATTDSADDLEQALADATAADEAADRQQKAREILHDTAQRLMLARELIGVEGEEAAAISARQKIEAAAAKEGIALTDDEKRSIIALAVANARLEEEADAAAKALQDEKDAAEELADQTRRAADSLEDMLRTTRQQTELLSLTSDEERELLAVRQQVINTVGELNIDAERYIVLLQDEVREQQRLRAVLKEVAREKREAEQRDSAIAALEAEINALRIEASLLELSTGERRERARFIAFEQKVIEAYGLAVGDTVDELRKFEEAVRNDEDLSEYGEGAAEAADKLLRFKDILEDLEQDNALQDLAADIGDAFGQAFEDVIFGAESVEDAIENLVKSTAQLIFNELVTQQIASFFTGLFGGAFGGGGFGFGAAQGAVFRQGSVQAFADGGIVDTPTYFPMSGNRVGLMGEGMTPEAVVPLPNGRQIPVDLKGAGGTNVTVNMNVSGVRDAVGIERSAAHISRKLGTGIKRSLSA